MPLIERFVKEWNLGKEEKFLKSSVGVFLLGCFLGELAPDPTDAIHFWLQAHVLNNPAYSTGFRAGLQVFDWYFMSATYFLLLLIVAYILHIRKVHIVKRVTTVVGILSVGAAIGIIAQFVAS